MIVNLYSKIEDVYNHHDIFCNQKYDKDLPYSFHLKSVVSIAEKYIHLIKDDFKSEVLLGAAGHDLIEDGRLTYNDIIDKYGVEVAEMIYSCTEEKGRTRHERHNEKFYKTLSKNRLAVFVKLCDYYSNLTYSFLKNSSMFKKYVSEFEYIEMKLYVNGEYDEIWNSLKKIIKL